ncbi:Protein transport protein sec20 [Cytospora paraplurivora]|uniref:Protein transport protein sec20 n=1 Tax=Cytospora paraplurivora TaxID=2898453 RepID=A0AAN9YJC6_9PEZI
MTFDSLQERLAALQETTAQVQELIDRLASLKFQPHAEHDEAEDEDDEHVAAELSAEISQTLREEEDDLELLAEEVTDLRGGKEGSEAGRRKERLREGLARLEAEVKSRRASFHKAQLTARRTLESSRRQERELLLQSYTTTAVQAAAAADGSTPSRSGANSPNPATTANIRRRQTHRHHHHNHHATPGPGYDDPVVAASSDLTLSLRRAHEAVTAELGRSMAVRGALAESTDKVRRLGSGYARVDDMLRSSRDLVGVLLSSSKSDTWYLQTTFYLLAATLGWLVFRRFVYGPLWWLVWFPVRLAFRTGSSAVGVVGGVGGGKAGAGMGVVDEKGSARVVGVGEEGAVPTVDVGGGGGRVAGEVGDEGRQKGDPDSMLEKIGRIVDRVEEQVGSDDGHDYDDATDGDGEEPAAEAEVFVPVSDDHEEAGRVRDEL